MQPSKFVFEVLEMVICEHVKYENYDVKTRSFKPHLELFKNIYK